MTAWAYGLGEKMTAEDIEEDAVLAEECGFHGLAVQLHEQALKLSEAGKGETRVRGAWFGTSPFEYGESA